MCVKLEGNQVSSITENLRSVKNRVDYSGKIRDSVPTARGAAAGGVEGTVKSKKDLIAEEKSPTCRLPPVAQKQLQQPLALLPEPSSPSTGALGLRRFDTVRHSEPEHFDGRTGP